LYEVGGDQKLLQDSASTILEGLGRDIAVMLFSVDQENEKLILCSKVSDNLSSRFPASDWVKSVATNFGGKGGGNVTRASGSINDLDHVNQAIHYCRNIANEKLI